MISFSTRGAKQCAAAAAVLAAISMLAACGGGGDGGGGSATSTPVVPPPSKNPNTNPSPDPDTGTPSDNISRSSVVANWCAAPRRGIDPATGAAFPDRLGTLALEQRWVRAWIDETYLWYDEVPTGLKAADYATPIAYFDALKTPKLTASGRPKDRFHFTYDTADFHALSQYGIEVGYGFDLAFRSEQPPRDVRIAFTEPGMPATLGGVARGDQVIAVDGADLVMGSDVDTLNAGLFPAREGETHSLRLRAPNGGERNVTLTSARVTRTPVQNVKTLATANGSVGYLLFNDHIDSAEAQLVAAIRQLQAANVSDLVIDLRYNGGGLLAMASELAYMVGGPKAAAPGAVFEKMQFNRKNPFGYTAAQVTLPFYSTARGFTVPKGTALPQLNLSRVTVLAGPDTCSASESVVNSLRGVGVEVNLIGAATCGKPYGFYPEDNCGTTYFAIQFQGVNQQGFGDYGDGFAPTCVVPDDFDHALGDPAEARLAAALTLRATGVCPGVSASKGRKAGGPGQAVVSDQPTLIRPPTRENRILRRADAAGL